MPHSSNPVQIAKRLGVFERGKEAMNEEEIISTKKVMEVT